MMSDMKILIIRLSSLGDIILTQPIVQRLHEAFPEAELHYLTKAQYKAIPLHFGVPLKIITYSKSIKSHFSLGKNKYDYIFDLQNKLNSFLIKLICCNAKSFTYDKQRRLRKAVVSHKTERGISSTLDLYQSALLQAAKGLKRPELVEGLNNPLLLVETDAVEAMQKRLPALSGKKLIALFPGALHNTKMYPARHFIEVIQTAGDNCHFLLLGSGSESALTYNINFETADRSTNLGGKFNPEELMAVIALADVVITNDSGPMHIAAALGKPQIAIFGSTHPRLGFRPLNDKAVILCKNVSCQPCSLHGRSICPRKHFACMLKVKPAEIVAILNSLA